MVAAFTQRCRIAYFSMEIALQPEIHSYAGGLGILAGDTVRSCADLELPVVFVTLISRNGYLRQVIDADGRQGEQPDPWEPERWAQPLGAKVAVSIEGRDVWVRPWLYRHRGTLGYEVPVVLLDTALDENDPEDRAITGTLYGGDDAYRLKQEVALGIGGFRLLRALGFEIETYHMNEGHSALLALQLLNDQRHADGRLTEGGAHDPEPARQRCVFTTHTPVEAGHDRFPYDLVERTLGTGADVEALKAFAGTDCLNMTRLALNLSGYVNGVAKRHAEISRHMFPGYRVHAITNGVHVETWTCESIAQLYQTSFPQWRHEPEVLVRADTLDDAAVWSAHETAKRALLDRVEALTGAALAPDVLMLGFARRMTGYKRPDLIFSNLDRLRALARGHPFQILVAGKAHPRDEVGKRAIEALHHCARDLAGDVPVVFLPGYDMELARFLTSGCDVWLNTPLPPLEASGTSGMKAALNGVLNLSVLDGWWMEACIDGVTGWAIGDADLGTAADDAEDLYHKLESEVLPLHRNDRARWIWMMKQSISKIASHFNSQRMMRRYAAEAYLR
ncbi:alpha-glucan family phosphorylase [Azospirillum sp. RWY-5-1]|uniref:glycogen phosphorylase n=1 Tax=Azospirillum oleiclasticum TaxID=2735135 RepID=A0ABX2TCS8_9PROT|nr:alpha-glucan family phosphorylase [Azospirillum oleiclasticum]NYZ14863.1 alpha-glucan family phosphorylase [Azospirillum oleiclasticum]NYZ22151.1 alpha-glucan family phosphorylase [Azospirillum oleiclasticum]